MIDNKIKEKELDTANEILMNCIESAGDKDDMDAFKIHISKMWDDAFHLGINQVAFNENVVSMKL